MKESLFVRRTRALFGVLLKNIKSSLFAPYAFRAVRKEDPQERIRNMTLAHSKRCIWRVNVLIHQHITG